MIGLVPAQEIATGKPPVLDQQARLLFPGLTWPKLPKIAFRSGSDPSIRSPTAITFALLKHAIFHSCQKFRFRQFCRVLSFGRRRARRRLWLNQLRVKGGIRQKASCSCAVKQINLIEKRERKCPTKRVPTSNQLTTSNKPSDESAKNV